MAPMRSRSPARAPIAMPAIAPPGSFFGPGPGSGADVEEEAADRTSADTPGSTPEADELTITSEGSRMSRIWRAYKLSVKAVVDRGAGVYVVLVQER